MQNSGAAPCTAMSLTQWLTRSAPTVECKSISNAIFSLVPTPSTLDTNTGPVYLVLSTQNSPPNPPVSLRTPADFAEHTPGKGLVRQILDALLGAIRAADVHPGVGVSNRRRAGWGSLGHRFFRVFRNPCVGLVPGAEATTEGRSL